MNERRSPTGLQTFHELPLVVFASLASAGCGLAAAHLLLSVWVGIPWVPPGPILLLSAVLTGAGVLASLAHLGRPLRSPRALARVGRSRLSNEVAICSLALVGLFLSLLLPQDHAWNAPAAYWGMGLSMLTLLALGRVYALPGQMTWGGSAIAQPLTLGTALGLSMLYDLLPLLLQPAAERALILALLADALVLALRWRALSRAAEDGAAAYPLLLRRRGILMLSRLGIGFLIPLAGVLMYRPVWIVTSLACALILDRVLFYGLAVRNSTEAGVSRLEMAIRAADSL
jgi:anaerobic dimethyl sulfoxide reductase subunit C (anchor subunit)